LRLDKRPEKIRSLEAAGAGMHGGFFVHGRPTGNPSREPPHS
jgi:hypothetical protein